ncbi:MAG: uracil-DNA glycosylase, partial [Gallionellaceae bacterium]|nr:uracil-DNA glycosylase [Gallionellaceae bacterium]
ERLLLEGAIPRLDAPTNRLTLRERPFSEPSATIVWKTLHRLGIADRTILWNAVQLHPHKPGNIRSNRTPTDAEIALGAPALRGLLDAFPQAKLVAVGRKAEGLVRNMGVTPIGSVRHPANGGATAFAAGVEQLL